MQFSTTRSDLTALLAAPVSASSGKSAQPSLAWVLLHASGDRLSATGTDLMTTMTASRAAEVRVPGKLCVPSKHFLQVISTMPAGGIEMKLLSGYWCELKSLAPKSKVTMKLQAYSDIDYPRIPAPPAAPPIAVDIGVLRTLLNATAYAICQDEARVNLTSLHLERNGDRLIAVATDGHRLAMASAATAFPSLADYPTGINIERRAVRLLLGQIGEMDGHVDVRVGFGLISFDFAGLSMVAKLSEHVFPPWRQVLRAGHMRTCTVEREPLQATVNRAMAMATHSTHSAVFSFCSDRGNPGELELDVENLDMGTMREAIDSVSVSGDGVRTMFNVAYVKETLEHLPGDKIVFKLHEAMDAAHITSIADGGSIDLQVEAVVMPIRIDR